MKPIWSLCGCLVWLVAAVACAAPAAEIAHDRPISSTFWPTTWATRSWAAMGRRRSGRLTSTRWPPKACGSRSTTAATPSAPRRGAPDDRQTSWSGLHPQQPRRSLVGGTASEIRHGVRRPGADSRCRSDHRRDAQARGYATAAIGKWGWATSARAATPTGRASICSLATTASGTPTATIPAICGGTARR